MKKVALVKRQLLSVAILRLVVIKRLDDLFRWECLDRLGCDGKGGCVSGLLIAL